MMHRPGSPNEQVLWYNRPSHKIRTLNSTITTDAVIVGGGFAGFAAAQSFAARGLKTVLLEQYYCGAGASGKSSGFITPDAELNLSRFEKTYGNNAGKTIWQYIVRGVEQIRSTIQTNNLECGYREQDTLVLANTPSGVKNITREHSNRIASGYESTLYENTASLQPVVNSPHFYAGVRYDGTFAVDPYQYITSMRSVLEQLGITIYEETPVLSLHNDHVITTHGRVNAKHIVVCADRFIPQLGKLNNDIFQMQTHIMVSNPLSDATIAQIFPNNRCMAWDTAFIYTYFRITADNRFLIGGGNYWNSYSNEENYHAHSVYRKFMRYMEEKFPHVSLTFEYMWPGLIGISKDIAPVIGRDKQMPNVYYVGACAGLPIATTLGMYSAEHLIDGKTDLDLYFPPHRFSTLSNVSQKVIGKPVTFALNNLYTMLST